MKGMWNLTHSSGNAHNTKKMMLIAAYHSARGGQFRHESSVIGSPLLLPVQLQRCAYQPIELAMHDLIEVHPHLRRHLLE